MFSWIAANIGTILICLVLLLVVTAIIVCLVRDKKKGKPSCGGNCAHCAMSGSCHPLIFQLEEIHGKPHLFDSLQHPVFAGRTGFGRRKRRTLR